MGFDVPIESSTKGDRKNIHHTGPLEERTQGTQRGDFTVRRPEPAVALRGYGGQEDEKGDEIHHGGAEVGMRGADARLHQITPWSTLCSERR